MKKILVILLVAALLGVVMCTGVTTQEEPSAESFPEWEGENALDPDVAPCGGGGNGVGAPCWRLSDSFLQ